MIDPEVIASLRAEIVEGRENAASWMEPPELARAFVAMYNEVERLLGAGEWERLAGAIAVAKAATVAVGPDVFGAGLRRGEHG